MNQLSINTGFASLAGHEKQNEDACGVMLPEKGMHNTKGIAAVIADGVSSSDNGYQASQLCLSSFLQDYYSTPESWSTRTSVQKVIGALNRWLYGRGMQQYQSEMGLVSTLSILILKSATAHIFHVGDTRIYRYRNGDLERLTHDHRILSNNKKTFLSRAMGISPNIELDYKKTAIEKDDIYLLASDGLYEHLSEKFLTETISDQSVNLEQRANKISSQAKSNGSLDDITCQLIEVDDVANSENNEDYYSRLTELPFPPDLEPGHILDGYKIIRELFGSKRTHIYLAYDIEQDTHVALKAPSVNYSDDAEYIDRFLNEEWIGRRLNNNHVLKIINHPRKRQCLYYVTEFLDGQTLRQWMQDNPEPSINEVRNIAKQIMLGLCAFHRMEMIHQDIKPENIFITRDGTIKIIDFGSTKIAGIEEINSPSQQSQHILGTLNYTAPELFEERPGSVQSDLYSLATICYEMLTQQLPYGHEPSKRKLQRATHIPALQHNDQVPLWVSKALEKALQKNPQLRYQELSEFVYDLNNPNPEFLNNQFEPLIKKNPIAFWQGLTTILFIANIIFIYLLLS